MRFIAITQRIEHISRRDELCDALDQRWLPLLNSLNLTPILMPNYPKHVQRIVENIPLAGLILSGGNDSADREVSEQLLLEYAIAQQLPVLGVCHGMQVIQRFFAIPVYPVLGHVEKRQEIYIHDKLTKIDSYHNHGTHENNDNFRIWAKAKDGVVKAIQHTTLPISGVMWHPERQQPYHNQDIALLSHLFCKDYLCAPLS